jgi:hypothetical protein
MHEQPDAKFGRKWARTAFIDEHANSFCPYLKDRNAGTVILRNGQEENAARVKKVKDGILNIGGFTLKVIDEGN